MYAVFCVYAINMFSQETLNYVINNMGTQMLPFEARKTTCPVYDDTYVVDNSSQIIPDKLYDNITLTRYTVADTDQEGNSFRKFAIPNSSNVLLDISFGGVTDWRTDILCVVAPNGTVLATLESYVMVCGTVVKQFRITTNNQIVVTHIVPVSTIPSGDYCENRTFTSFMGQRIDTTYSIENKYFLQVAQQMYQPQTYTLNYLDFFTNKNQDLWNGGEIPM